MTAEDNGVPEDDDPFAYLYRGQEGDDARNVAQQPGVPRTSYQQATQVGRVQYGQPRPQPGGQSQAPQYPGQQSQAPQYPGQQPQQQYPGQQPQQQPAAPQGSQLPPSGGGGGRSRSRSGGSNRAVTYGAIGVALAVVVGIGVAVLDSGGTPKPSPSAAGSGQTASTAPSSASTSPSASATAPSGATNVSGMTLGGGAVVMNNHTGGVSTDGKFVPLTASGMSVTWNNVTVPTAGPYTFWVHYANAGSAKADPFTLTVNGKALPNTINLTNWDNINDWNKAWQRSYSPVTLNAGSNTIAVSYGSGSNAGVNVDQFAVTVSDNTPPWP